MPEGITDALTNQQVRDLFAYLMGNGAPNCLAKHSGFATVPPSMAYINEHYLKLQAGYLFPEIGRRVNEFTQANPDRRAPDPLRHWRCDRSPARRLRGGTSLRRG